MKTKSIFAVFAVVVLAAGVVIVRLRKAPAPPPVEAAPMVVTPAGPSVETAPQRAAEPALAPRSFAGQTRVGESPAETPTPATNRVEQLAQIRESFRRLAGGDPAAAMRAAKQLTNEVERETALLALVTEWSHGELRSPSQRARAILSVGLEAGLGMELAGNPDLAVLWANELTDGRNRAALLEQTAIAMVDADPAAAFALNEQLSPAERQHFFDSVFGGWARKDTDAALQWADQFSDPAERDAAMKAIRGVAPVGIGTELAMKDGYPVIMQLIPGAPAELSGQIRPGDRIVALAQGDNTFVDARTLAMKDLVEMIRGAPGSTLQLQVLPADAPPNSVPRSVTIIRDQVKFKR